MFSLFQKSPTGYQFSLKNKSLALKGSHSQRSLKSALMFHTSPKAKLVFFNSLLFKNFKDNPMPVFVLSDDRDDAYFLATKFRKNLNVPPQVNNVILYPELVDEFNLDNDTFFHDSGASKNVIETTYSENSLAVAFVPEEFKENIQTPVYKEKFIEFLEKLTHLGGKHFLVIVAYVASHFNEIETQKINDCLAKLKQKNCTIMTSLSDMGQLAQLDYPALGTQGLYDEFWFCAENIITFFKSIKDDSPQEAHWPDILKSHLSPDSDFLQIVQQKTGYFFFRSNQWEFVPNFR